MIKNSDSIGAALKQAAAMRAERPMYEIVLDDIDAAMPDEGQLLILEELIKAVESLRIETPKGGGEALVLGWIESLIQYGLDYLESSESPDYRLEIFKLYFSIINPRQNFELGVEQILAKLDEYRNDNDFAAEVIDVMVSKLPVLERVLEEKSDKRLKLLEDKKRLLKDIGMTGGGDE